MHWTRDWFKIQKGVHQGCILSSCLFNFYEEYIMWNAGLDEAQAGIKIAGRNININNLRYANDTTVMAESKEELKSLLMKVKEESEKAGLEFNIQKTKIMASSPNTSWQIDGEAMKTVTDYFLGLQNHCRWWLQPWNEKMLAPWKKSYDQPQFSSVQSLSRVCSDPMDCSMPGFPVHHQLPELKLLSIESVMPSNHLILCHPLLLPSIFPSIRLFSNK